MQILKVDQNNFWLFAAHYYDNPECYSDEEFEEDLNRFKYLKRLLRKYYRSGHLDAKSTRLILNHIILILNVFGTQPGAALLFYKIDDELHYILKPFLTYLHALPKYVNEINTTEIGIDSQVVQRLQEI